MVACSPRIKDDPLAQTRKTHGKAPWTKGTRFCIWSFSSVHLPHLSGPLLEVQLSNSYDCGSKLNCGHQLKISNQLCSLFQSLSNPPAYFLFSRPRWCYHPLSFRRLSGLLKGSFCISLTTVISLTTKTAHFYTHTKSISIKLSVGFVV